MIYNHEPEILSFQVYNHRSPIAIYNHDPEILFSKIIILDHETNIGLFFSCQGCSRLIQYMPNLD